MLNRRTVLAAAAATALGSPARGEDPADAALRARLDRLQAALKASGPEALAAAALDLAAFDPAGLSPVRRREYEVVLAGLRQEAALARAPTYAGRLGLALGAAVSPDQAEAWARAEIQALSARADRLLRRAGVAKGSVGARLRAFAEDPRGLYPDSSAGRDAAVAEMNRRLAAIRPRLGRAFGELPVAAVVVRRMSPADEAAGRGGYREPPSEGRPGVYYVDLKAIRTRPAWTLPSVAHHELIPGHLLQIPLQAAAGPHPLRLRYASAYFEAWAIYAERLALELGAYRHDPLGELGQVQWRLFRIGRVLADIGLNARGWSPDQARAALAETQGFPAAFISFEEDVRRMGQSPGKAAAEGLGALAFDRLRARGLARLGLIGFHRAMLAQGPWPFDALGRMIGA